MATALEFGGDGAWSAILRRRDRQPHTAVRLLLWLRSSRQLQVTVATVRQRLPRYVRKETQISKASS